MKKKSVGFYSSLYKFSEKSPMMYLRNQEIKNSTKKKFGPNCQKSVKDIKNHKCQSQEENNDLISANNLEQSVTLDLGVLET